MSRSYYFLSHYRSSPHFMEPKRSFKCSQHPPTHPYSQPGRSTLLLYGPLPNFQISCKISMSQVVPKAMSNCEVMYNISYNVDCFCGEKVLSLRKTPKLEDHRLSAVRGCLVYSQLPSIFGGRHLYPQSEDAPCRDDRDRLAS